MPIRLHSQPSDPFATLARFRQEIDRMFGAPAPAPRSLRSPGGRWSAPDNIYETDGALVVRLPVAGIDPAKIEVTVEDGTEINGFGAYLCSIVQGLASDVRVDVMGVADRTYEHAARGRQLEWVGLTAEGIADNVRARAAETSLSTA